MFQLIKSEFALFLGDGKIVVRLRKECKYAEKKKSPADKI